MEPSRFLQTYLIQSVDSADSDSGAGTGTVIASGIKCGNADGTAATDCEQTYTKKTTVTLKAVADKGSAFSSWDGCDKPSNTSCTVTMDTEDVAVTALFEPTKRYAVTITKDGNGLGKVTTTQKGVDNTGTINCDAGNTDCESTYIAGTTITLIAKADKGTFIGWKGYAACEKKVVATCKITKIAANLDITATFGKPEISVSDSALDFGDVVKKKVSSPQTFTITNNGLVGLTATFKFTGADPKMFKVTNSAGKSVPKATVAAGASTTFNVIFTPSAVGDKKATLTITSNDPDNKTKEILLSGTGVAQ